MQVAAFERHRAWGIHVGSSFLPETAAEGSAGRQSCWGWGRGELSDASAKVAAIWDGHHKRGPDA